MGKNLTIIGAGAVATALGLALARNGYRVLSVISRTRSSAARLSKKVKCRIASASVADIHPDTNLLLIAVPDREVAAVAKSIAARASLQWKTVFTFHTSGLLTSESLHPLSNKGARTFSLHPIQTFPRNATRESLTGISYGFEGKRSAEASAKLLVKDLRGQFLNVPKDAKVLYHCACVIASNYPVVLLNVVDELARRRLKPGSLRHFRALTETSIRNAFEANPRSALTGPIARGDAHTVQAHVHALLKSSRETIALYRALGIAAARMSRANGLLNSSELKELTQLLSIEYEHLSL